MTHLKRTMKHISLAGILPQPVIVKNIQKEYKTYLHIHLSNSDIMKEECFAEH